MPSTSKTKGQIYQDERLVKLLTGYRSKFEQRLADQLTLAAVPFKYECDTYIYTIPERTAKYTPDFNLNGKIFIEAKGWFREASERQKYILAKKSNPDLDLRFVFGNASKSIYKNSKTTYAQWADKNGFLWAEGKVPTSWIKEALG